MTDPSLADKIIGWGLLLFLIAAPTIAVFFKRTTGAAVLAAVGAAALVFTRLPDISDLDLFALKVRLARQSQEVEVTLKQLQKLAVAEAKVNLAQLAYSAQLSARIGKDEIFKLHDQIIDSLEVINVPSN